MIVRDSFVFTLVKGSYVHLCSHTYKSGSWKKGMHKVTEQHMFNGRGLRRRFVMCRNHSNLKVGVNEGCSQVFREIFLGIGDRLSCMSGYLCESDKLQFLAWWMLKTNIAAPTDVSAWLGLHV